MNLAEFFRNDAVTLPVDGFQEGAETFDIFLSRAFAGYAEALKQLDDKEHPDICFSATISSASIGQLSNEILLAVRHYLSGNPSKAYQCAEKALGGANVLSLTASLGQDIIPGLPEQPPWPDGIPTEVIEGVFNPRLYRMRTGAPASDLSPEQIFHVPFEKRHLVSNQRYSIAGLPCLYLGSSTWICWEELGRPDLDKVFVSQFRVAKEVKVLDFQLTPGRCVENV